MVVWRVIEREIVRQMATMKIKHMEPSRTKSGRHVSPYQMVDPDPRQRPERDLQRARPIDSALKRIPGDPALELRANLIQVRGVAGQQVRLRKNHQVLMPVQLPNDFVIARPAPYPRKARAGNRPDRSRYPACSRAANGFRGQYRWSNRTREIGGRGSPRRARSLLAQIRPGPAISSPQ